MKVLVGSKNEAKIRGARAALEEYFNEVEIMGIDVSSEVPDQPCNEQIYQGAKNRVKNLKAYARENHLEADLFLAIESGLTNELTENEYSIINVAVVEDNHDLKSFGISSGFPVPEKYVEEIKSKNLNTLMERLFKEQELNRKLGAIACLTDNKITRIDMTKQAFVMALIHYRCKEIW